MQIQDFLVHFWQGMPSHMLPILSNQTTVDLVVVCDFILYSVSKVIIINHIAKNEFFIRLNFHCLKFKHRLSVSGFCMSDTINIS